MPEECPTQREPYDLRLMDLPSPPGHISAALCVRIVASLQTAAERTVRLRVSGDGKSRGRKPAWLQAATDLTITRLGQGSTVMGIEASPLAEAVPKHFGESLFDTSGTSGVTCLDLVARAVRAARQDGPEVRVLDASVLEALHKMGTALDHPGATWTLTSRRTRQTLCSVDRDLKRRAKSLLREIPAARLELVTGRLNAIAHEEARFHLLLGDGTALPGQLNPDLDREVLRPLWGKPVTALGTVRFRPDGLAQTIEVQRIAQESPGDEVFAARPAAVGEAGPDLFTGARLRGGYARPMDLVGTWPGDEPIEDLLAQLKSI